MDLLEGRGGGSGNLGKLLGGGGAEVTGLGVALVAVSTEGAGSGALPVGTGDDATGSSTGAGSDVESTAWAQAEKRIKKASKKW